MLRKFLITAFLSFSFLFFAGSVLATTGNLGSPMHMPVNMAFASDTATTTLNIFLRAGSPDYGLEPWAAVGTAPTSSASSTWPQIFYKNVMTGGDNDFIATSTCVHQGAGFHRCSIPAYGSTTVRTLQYYIVVSDTDDTTNIATSSTPFSINVQNSALGTHSVSGHTIFGMGLFSSTVTNATDTVQFSVSPYDYTNYPAGRINTDDWVYIENGSSFSTTTKVVEVSTTSSPYWIRVSGPVDLPAGAEVHKKLSNVWLFANGTTFNATSSGADDFNFGTFSLANMATGTYELIAFKAPADNTNFCDAMINGIFAPTQNFKIFVTAGCNPGGGGMNDKFEAMWTAPCPNMMGAQREISLDKSPILIGLSQSATTTSLTLQSSTSSPQTIYVKKIVNGTPQDITSSGGFQLAYQGQNQSSITLLPGGATASYNFGPDEKIIVYSATTLEQNTTYIVELTNGIFNLNGTALSGNRPEGGHILNFTTSLDFANSTGTYGGGGQYMPPFVTGVIPTGGSFGVSTNSKIVISFSQAMDSASLTNNVRIYRITSAAGVYPETSEQVTGLTLSLDNVTKDKLVISKSGGFTAGRHRIEVRSGAKSSSGITIGPADQDVMVFQSDFEITSGTDTTGPKVLTSNYSNNATNVPLVPVIELVVNEAFNPATINTTNINLKAGTTAVTGNVNYNSLDNIIRWVPSAALMTNTNYVLTVTASTTDLAGVALDGNGDGTSGDAYTLSFTTIATSDTSAPSLFKVEGDDYKIAVTFSEPMKSASVTDTTNWGNSVLNPSNYTIKYAATNPCSGSLVATSSLRINYDAVFKTAMLENLMKASDNQPLGSLRDGSDNLTIGQICLQVSTSTKDLSGNSLPSGTQFIFTPKDSKQTFGMIGPMTGPMMGPPTTAGGEMGPSFGTQSVADMGMMKKGVMPMNAMAGATTVYFIDLQVMNRPANNDKIILTFPLGFDVTNAVKDSYSTANNDLNGPAQGTIVLSTTTADAANRQITLQLAVTGTPMQPEFLHMDLSGITNPANPQKMGPSFYGYTIGVELRDSSDNVKESFQTMPFFINEAGAYSITVGVTASTTFGVSASVLPVMLGSPMTGPMQGTITYAATSTAATTTFSGLVAGEYFFFTESLNALNVCNDAGCTSTSSKDFLGVMMPEPIRITDASTTKNFIISREDASSSIPISVILNGDFKGDQVDIFAGSPSGFTVKTISSTGTAALTGCAVGVCANATATVYLAYRDNWNVGIGIAQPKGPMSMGPMPVPEWLPPANVQVFATGTSESPSCTESSGTANDCKVHFTIRTATNKIVGYVKDASGTAIPDAGIDAFKTEGFGSPAHTTTDVTGYFEMKVATGTYGLSIYKPGLPPMPPKTITVLDNTGVSDGNSTADVYWEGGILITVANPLIIKVDKGSLTISGKILDDTDAATAKPVSYAPVWANNASTGEFVPSGTDATGNFILYVKAGAWRVSGHIPGSGDLLPQDVTITTKSVGNIVLKPSVAKGNMATISGTVTVGGASSTNAHIWVEGTEASGGRRYENGAPTDSSGIYKLTVPAGTYNIHCYVPDYGEIGVGTNVTLTAAQAYTKNFTVATANTVNLSFSFTNAPANTRGFVDVFDPDNRRGQGREIANVASSTETMKVPQGEYFIKLHIPGFGSFDSASPAPGSNGKVDLSATTSSVITFTLPTAANQITVSGTVTAGGTPVYDAFVWIENMTQGFHYGVQSGATGTYSLKVQKGTYRMGVDKPGYTGPMLTDTTFNADSTSTDFALTLNQYSISGTIKNATGTGISRAWVWADRVAGANNFIPAGGWSGTETDSSGNYTLSVGSGYWRVRAVAEGYQETASLTAYDASANPSTANLTLPAISGFTAKEPKSKPMSPATGGTFDDRANTGVKLVVPPTVLGSDTNNAKILIKETTAVPTTDLKRPIGGIGKEITVYDNSDQAIKNLSGSVEIEMTYSDADVTAAGITESQLTLSYWDESNKEWTEIPSSIDTTNNIIRAEVSHFSVFAPTASSGANPPSVPSTPSGTVSGSSITVSWTASTDDVKVEGYEVYRSTSLNGTFSNVSGDSWGSGNFSTSTLVATTCTGTCTWTNSSLSDGTYYYKVAAFDNGGRNSTSSDASSALTVQTTSTGGGGGGGITQDVIAPAISQITVTAGDTLATISWKTDEASISWLIYGTSTAYGLEIKTTTSTTSHSLTVTGLSPQTSYHYQIKSRDGSNNTASYTDQTFTTLALGEKPKAAEEEKKAKPKETVKPVSQMTIEELRTEITRLLTLISQLQVRLGKAPAVPAVYEGIPVSFIFKKNLSSGATDSDVVNLKIVLQKEGCLAGVNNTEYFASKTKAAVKCFCQKYQEEISQFSGYQVKCSGLVGRGIRAKLNQLISK